MPRQRQNRPQHKRRLGCRFADVIARRFCEGIEDGGQGGVKGRFLPDFIGKMLKFAFFLQIFEIKFGSYEILFLYLQR